MAVNCSCRLYLSKLHRQLSSVLSFKRNYVYRKTYTPPGTEPGRYPFLKKRVPKVGRLTFEERIKALSEATIKHPDLKQPIDIGLPELSPKVKEMPKRRQRDPEEIDRMEDAIPLSEIQEEWSYTGGCVAITKLAYHLNIYKDLFREPHFFVPRVPMDLFFVDHSEEVKTDDSDDEVFALPIYYGNCIPASDTSESPNLRFRLPPTVDDNSLWTLVMTSPDEHLQEQDKEYLHWMITNIPIGSDGYSDVNAGDVICPYLPPIPPRGTGHHRYIYVLYHQESRVDLSSETRSEKCDLNDRTFSTYNFYRGHQDVITPAGLSFHQTCWDSSVKERYHHLLDMPEPTFEFEWPMEYRAPQERFPGGQSFDKYLDKYRDVKDINEQVLKERLTLAHPFQDYPERPKYPMAIPFPDGMPSWQRDKEKQKRLRQGIWKDLP